MNLPSPALICFIVAVIVKMSWQKAKRESKDDSVGDMKHGRKKRERLFKKRFSALNFFSGPSKSKL